VLLKNRISVFDSYFYCTRTEKLNRQLQSKKTPLLCVGYDFRGLDRGFAGEAIGMAV